MIVKQENCAVEIRERMREGPGQVKIINALVKEQYPPHCRLFAPILLEKGCGIGSHTHTGEAEIFYCIQGEGVYNDNGKECPFRQGDMSVTYSGQSHSVRNEKDETLIIMAAIITE
jgi:mannose-6-phosphate isomerase-like protein (cupin superfamily)